MSAQNQLNESLVRLERVCPECGNENIIRDHETAEIVCVECGFVITDKIFDRGPEWRAFDVEQREKRTRVGAPITQTIHDKGLTTMIGYRNRYGYNKKSSSEKQAQLHRMRKWQSRLRVSGSTERNLASALSTMSKISSSMTLPKNIVETASIIYRKAVRKRLLRGRSTIGVVAASLYMACRKCGMARTLREVASSSNISKKELAKSYRFMHEKLREHVPPVPPSHYVSRFVNHLELIEGAEIIAINILNEAKKSLFTSGKGPLGLAAAATYISSILIRDNRTQRECAEVADVTEVTIRNRYKDLLERLEIKIIV
jgi:transcription initiation factor TFIIB